MCFIWITSAPLKKILIMSKREKQRKWAHSKNMNQFFSAIQPQLFDELVQACSGQPWNLFWLVGASFCGPQSPQSQREVVNTLMKEQQSLLPTVSNKTNLHINKTNINLVVITRRALNAVAENLKHTLRSKEWNRFKLPKCYDVHPNLHLLFYCTLEKQWNQQKVEIERELIDKNERI